MTALFVRYRRLQRRIRGGVLAVWIRIGGGSVGRRLQAERGVHLRWRPHRGLVFGDGVYLGVGTILDVPSSAKLVLGDRVKVMHYCVLAASEEIQIGADTQIAEMCSIRDADHGTSLDGPMREQLLTEPTAIGADVWIGRGSVVLKGTLIGEGAVVGANSVARGVIPPRVIAVGAPTRVIRSRGAAPPQNH
ncbi:acyltransferase [Micropruina sp.]|uniref:acyltransferase n=1 Tax=Micropruina sp. TaxID=2737536 RepID=UPI0039E3E1A9